MAKADPIERALDRLGELRQLDASEPIIEELRGKQQESRADSLTAPRTQIFANLGDRSDVRDRVAAELVLERHEVDESELPCRVNDPDLYFAESPSDVELAKSLCQDCPVRVECLAGAVRVAGEGFLDSGMRASPGDVKGDPEIVDQTAARCKEMSRRSHGSGGPPRRGVKPIGCLKSSNSSLKQGLRSSTFRIGSRRLNA